MMMVETVLESSQDFGMSCVWKREVCRRALPPSPPRAPPPPEEELRYGPGIVSRLKSRYLSLTTPELRRASSLETLEEAPPPAPPPAPRLPRARSVEALSPIRRPRRPTPLVPPAQRPAAAVKDSARRYDPPRRAPAPRVSAVVREFEARAGVRSNGGSKYWSRPPPCVVSATNPVLVGSRRVGVIRPLPARAPSPRPPPSPAPPSPRPPDRTDHTVDQVDKSPSHLDRSTSQIDRSPSHQTDKSPPSAMVEPMPRFEEKMTIVQLWEQRISESPEKIVPKPKVDHILPPKPEITTPKPEAVTKPQFPTHKAEAKIKPNCTSPKIDVVTKPCYPSPKLEIVTKPSLLSPKPESMSKPSFPSPTLESMTKPSLSSPTLESVTKPSFPSPTLESLTKPSFPSPTESSTKPSFTSPKPESLTKPGFPSPTESLTKPSFTSPKPESLTKPSFPSPVLESLTKPCLSSPKTDSATKPSFPSLSTDVLIKPNFPSPKLESIVKPNLPSSKVEALSKPNQSPSPKPDVITKPNFSSTKVEPLSKPNQSPSPKPDAVMKPNFSSPKVETLSKPNQSPVKDSVAKCNLQMPKHETVIKPSSLLPRTDVPSANIHISSPKLESVPKSESVNQISLIASKSETKISTKPDLIQIETKKTEPLTNGHKEHDYPSIIPVKQRSPEPAPIVSEKIVGIAEKVAKLDKISTNTTEKISSIVEKITNAEIKKEKSPEPKLNGSCKISAAKIDRPWSRSEKSESNEVSVSVSDTSPARRHVRDPPGSNSVVFNFSSRKEVPDYIENDGLILRAAKKDKIKAGDPGVVVLCPELVRDDDDEDPEEAEEGPPSPCGVRFVNDNVLINGKSSLSHSATKSRANKPRLQFDDSLTRTFEYPSETSLCDDESTAPQLSAPHNALPTNTHITSSSLSSYSPWKTSRDQFTLGVTRVSLTHTPVAQEHTEVEEERPPTPPSWTEARTTNTDLLF